MYKESADTIIKCTKDTFSLAVLLARVRTGEAEMSSMAGKQGMHGSAIELAPIVCLERKDGELKLGLNVREELCQDGENFRFVFQRKCPCIVCIVIEHNQVKLISGNAYNWRRPYIKVQCLKGKQTETRR